MKNIAYLLQHLLLYSLIYIGSCSCCYAQYLHDILINPSAKGKAILAYYQISWDTFKLVDATVYIPNPIHLEDWHAYTDLRKASFSFNQQGDIFIVIWNNDSLKDQVSNISDAQIILLFEENVKVRNNLLYKVCM